mmetsp:Transcript_10923/g.11998  ORF Transcript_10923/g.11998 Transcript_10923/m.11998 type:complete len:527 (+) Transcript_10923:21-1601(+)
MSLLLLPNELLDQLCAYLSPYSLAALSLASRRYRWISYEIALLKRSLQCYYPELYYGLIDRPETIQDKPPWWRSRWEWADNKRKAFFVKLHKIRIKMLVEKGVPLELAYEADAHRGVNNITISEAAQVTQLMKSNPDDLELLTLACYVTKRMCFQQIDDGQDSCEQEKKFYEAKVVTIIIDGLKRFSKHPLLCQDSAGALGNLSLYENNHKLMCDAGIVNTLMNILDLHFGEAQVIHNVLFCLANLSHKLPNISARLVEASVLEKATNAMKRYKDHKQLQDEVCFFFRNITYISADYSRRLLEIGAVDQLLSYFENFFDNVHSDAYGLVINLALDEKAVVHLFDAKILQILKRHMLACSGDSTILDFCCSALRNFATYSFCRPQIIELGLADIVMDTIEKYQDEILIVDAAVTFFTNLLHDEKHIEQLIRRRVVHSYCLAVANHPKDDNIVNDTFFGLVILLEHNNELVTQHLLEEVKYSTPCLETILDRLSVLLVEEHVTELKSLLARCRQKIREQQRIELLNTV